MQTLKLSLNQVKAQETTRESHQLEESMYTPHLDGAFYPSLPMEKSRTLSSCIEERIVSAPFVIT